jgi:hypothetical protein
MPTKPWYQSKGVLGGIASGVPALVILLKLAGIDIADLSSELSAGLIGAVGLVGTIVAIYGRITASKPIAPAAPSTFCVPAFLVPLLCFGLVTGSLTSCSSTSAVAPTITNSAVGKVGTDLNTAAQQALADYANVKANGVDYVWALGQMFNTYATVATTRADVEALVAQWGGTKDQSTANRIADLFGGSSGRTTTRMLALGQAALDTANNLTKGGTAKPGA